MNVSPALSNESRTIEILVEKCGSSGVFVGVGTIIQDGFNVGSSTNSWGYMFNGKIYVNGGIKGEVVGFSDGDVIRMEYKVSDNGGRELLLFKNNFEIGTCPEFTKETTIGRVLYWQVTVYTTGDQMRILAPGHNLYPNLDNRVHSQIMVFQPATGFALENNGKVAKFVGPDKKQWFTGNLSMPLVDQTQYAEVQINSISTGGVFVGIGAVIKDTYNVGNTATSWGYMSTGTIYRNGTVIDTIVGYVAGDVIGVYFKILPNGEKQLFFYKNGINLGQIESFSKKNTAGTKLYFQVTMYGTGDKMTLLNTPHPKK